jgi:hypothetical protein
MRTLHVIVAVLATMLGMAAPAHRQTVKVGTTPSFIFLPPYAAEQLGYFKGEFRAHVADPEIIELGLVTGECIGFGRLIAALDLENPRQLEA